MEIRTTFNPDDMIEADYAFDAMCVFECCLDTTYRIPGPVNSPILDWFHEGEGICNARSNIIDFTQWVRRAWDFNSESGEYPFSFDLDFVPAFMDKVVDFGMSFRQWMDPANELTLTLAIRVFVLEILRDATK